MLFVSPPEKDVEWSDEGVKGAFRFLNRVWRLFEKNLELIRIAIKMHKEVQKDNTNSATKERPDTVVPSYRAGEGIQSISSKIKKLRYSTHSTIKKVIEDIEDRTQYNTAIAAIMEHLNNVYGITKPEKLNNIEKAVYAEACIIIPRLLYFFAPHISEELWSMLDNETLVHEAGVQQYNKDFLVKDEVTYVVQIMGKIRGKLEIAADASEEEIKQKALEIDNVKKYLEGKEVKKIIVVPKKLVSIVAK